MSDFNDFLNKVVGTPRDVLVSMVYDLSLKCIPALSKVVDDDANGVLIFTNFLMTALAADGRLADEEFTTVEPFFKALLGDEFDYKQCKKLIKNSDDKKIVDLTVKLVHSLPDELAKDLILLAIIICAVDGEVSKKERVYIERLLS